MLVQRDRASVSASQLLMRLLSILQKAAIDARYCGSDWRNLSPNTKSLVPLSIDLLKEIRAWLISLEPTRGKDGALMAQGNARNNLQVGTGQAKDIEAGRLCLLEVVTATADIDTPVTAIDSTVTEQTRVLFALIVNTACLPSLTNPHRTTTCDVLSTWLIRASSRPITPSNMPLHHLLCTPFHHFNPSAPPLDIAEHHLSIFKTLTHIFLASFDSFASAALSKSLKDFIVTLLGCYKNIFHLESSSGGDGGFVDGLVTETLALIGVGSPKAATASLTITPLSSESSHKSVYFILEVLAIRKVAPAEYLLAVPNCSSSSQQEHNLLLSHLLTTVCTKTHLASAAAKAFLAILAARKAELLQQGVTLVVWEGIWNDLLRAALRGDLVPPDGTHEGADGASKAIAVARGNLTTYILPGVFKLAGIDGLQHLVAGFRVAMDVMSQPKDLNAWLCCIRVGREMGIVDDIGTKVSAGIEPSADSTSPMHLPLHIFPSLLTHSSLPIRISALILITTSRKTTLSPSTASFSLLRAYLPYFHAVTDPEGRNTIAGLIRSFIERLAGVSQSITRKACWAHIERGGLAQELDLQVAEIRRFVEWYVSFIRSEMLPGKSFSRVGMALRVLRMWVNSGVDQPLSSVTEHGTKTKTSGYGSPRFPFCVPIFNGSTAETREMTRLLLECLFHSFEDVRMEAAEVIKMCLLPISACAREYVDQRFLRLCFRKAQTGSGRMKDADGLARALEIVYEAAITWKDGFRVSSDLLGGADIEKVVILSTPLQYLTYLIEVILCGNILAMLKTSGLVEGVKRCSAIHGVISGLRHIFERKDIYDLIPCTDEAYHLAWRGLHHKLISVCYTIWDIVGPALCAVAPEGYMPDTCDEEDKTEDFDFGGDDVSTQMVMSFSWRAIKESSELLSTLILRAPYPDILNLTDISYSGEILNAQLASIRHPGAFAAVFPCFLQVCKKCFCSDPRIREIPRQWLMENLALIVTKAGTITRRSAGIPFLLVGILRAENDPERPLLKETFAKFVEIANMPPLNKRGKGTDESGGTKLDLPQVHALNCIKLLFIDSHLGPIALDLISSGLKVAVHSFSSPIWAIRNGGLMLFTALLNRLFGTSKSRNDYSFTANLYTTRRFFEKYPEVREVLLSQLQRGVDSMLSPPTNLESNVPTVEMVYPALSLVSRLGFSPGYVAMNEFKPLIEKCMKSHIGKVREVAAKAYITLICPNHCILEIQHLLDSSEQEQRQNTLHGNLLVVKCLLEQRIVDTATKVGVESAAMVEEVSRILEYKFNEFVRRNECLVTRALYLEIAENVAFNYAEFFSMTLGASSKVDIATASLRSLLLAYATKATILSEAFVGSKLVGNSTFKQQVAILLVHSFIREASPTQSSEIISLILEDDEVTLAITNVLLQYPDTLNLFGDHTTLLKTTLWHKAVSDSSWEQVRIACMQLLHVVLRHYPEHTLIDGSNIDCMLLLDLIQRPRTLPLKETALVVLGRMMHHIFLSDLGNRWQLLSAWMEQVHAASHEEMPYSSRKAALCSLMEMATVLDLSLSSCRQHFFLPLFMSLYRFLNDDNEEIRDLASVVLTQNVFHMDYQMIPLAASDMLARKLGELFGTNILDMAVSKMMGENDIQDLIDETRRNREVLFIKEKENLWVDELWEVDLWKEIINRIIQANGGKGDDIEIPLKRLLTFVKHGLSALLNYRCEVEDKEGLEDNTSSEIPFGWTTDVFVLGKRVFRGLEIVKLWVSSMGAATEAFGPQWPMVMELEQCIEKARLFKSAAEVKL